MDGLAEDRILVLARHPRNHLYLDPDKLVICPNREIARDLHVPPVTFDEIARDVLGAARLSVASDDVTLRCLREACVSTGEVKDAGGLARTALTSVNLLFRTGVDLAKLAHTGSERVQMVAKLAGETRLRLRAMGAVAKSDAVGAAALLPLKQARLLVFGYSRLGVAERSFVDAYAAPGSTIYLPNHDPSPLFEEMRQTALFFEGRGWTIERGAEQEPVTVGQRCADVFLGLPADLGGASVCSYPNPEEEVRAVLGRIKADVVKGLYRFEDAVLVTRSEAVYGPIVREIAWEYRMPVQTHDSAALIDTRLGRWLAGVLDIAESCEFGFEATARLFHSTLGGALVPDGWEQSEMWDLARSVHARTERAWSAAGASTDAVQWPESATRAEWAALLTSLLRRIEVQNRLASSSIDIAAYECLTEALVEMAMPAADTLERSAWIEEVRDMLAVVSTGAGAAHTGLQLHTPLALFGASVAHVFVLGASEGMLPRSIRDESLIDFHERKMLQKAGIADIETAAEAARREFLSLYSLLLVPAESVRFSYPRLSGGQKQELSPLIARIGMPHTAPSAAVLTAASDAELAGFELAGDLPPTSQPALRAAQALSVTLRREVGSRIDEHTGAIGLPFSVADRSFSASQLTVFGQCPYAWFTQRILRISDPDEAADDLEPSAKGSLFHAVLKRAASGALGKSDQRAIILAALEDSFATETSAMPELSRLPGWKGRRAELLAQLRRAVESAAFLQEDAEIVAVERDFETTWQGLRVRGRIDRVDQVRGSKLVVDYKTSASKPGGAKGADGKLSVDVQLPIYIHAEQAESGADVGGCYYSLSSGKLLGSPYGEASGGGRLAALPEEELEALAERLTASLEQGSFPVDPDSDFAACTYCASDSICRKGPHVLRAAGEAGA